MRKSTWIKHLTSFGSCCYNSWTLCTRSSLCCCSASHFRNKYGNPSQPKPQSQSRHWISKLRECRMKIWSWMRAGGKAVGWQINSIPVVMFFQGQQGALQEPLETSLTFPASFCWADVEQCLTMHEWNMLEHLNTYDFIFTPAPHTYIPQKHNGWRPCF